jgi:hypothetical protein
VFFGGTDQNADAIEGLDIYDVDQDQWFSDGFNSPARRENAAWGDGDLTFWISGGRLASGSPSDEICYYSFSSENWVYADSTPLSARWGGFGAFVAGEYHTWGGRDVDELFADGVHYTGWWADMTSQSAPSARYASHRESGWAWAFGNASMVLLGGLDAPSSYLADGAIYDTSADEWSPISAWPGTASHAFGTAGIAAGELIVWGGRNGVELTNEGARYLLD